MSLVHADNFSMYGTTAANLLSGVYSSDFGISLPTDPDGVSSGNVCFLSGPQAATDAFLRKVVTLDNTYGVGLRLWMPNLPNGTSFAVQPIMFRDASLKIVGYLRVNPAGTLSFYANATSGGTPALVGTTANPVITAKGWWHIECKVTALSATNGSMELRVEGQTVLNLTGLTFSGNQIQFVEVALEADSGGASRTYYIKDWFMWSGSGSHNNDFLGSCIVHPLVPNADVTLGGWTSTAANAWSVLDNSPPSNAAFISAGIGGPAEAEVSLSDLPSDITSVRGVIIFSRAAKSDGGDGSLHIKAKSDGVEGGGTDRPITTSQNYYQDVHETDPSTTALWTPDGVNDMTVTIDRTL